MSMFCYFEFTPDLVYIINLLHSFKYTQLSLLWKYMHNNNPNNINILYLYTYLIIVSNICTQKHVVMLCLFLLNVLIESHINIHTEEKYLKCTIYRMVKYEDLLSAKHTGDKTYKCNKYGGLPSAIHIGEKPFKCNICELMNYEAMLITKHRAMHIRENPIKCNICGMVRCEGRLITMLSAMFFGEEPFKCNICGMVKYEGLLSDSWDNIGIYLHTTPTKKWLCQINYLSVHTI